MIVESYLMLPCAGQQRGRWFLSVEESSEGLGPLGERFLWRGGLSRLLIVYRHAREASSMLADDSLMCVCEQCDNWKPTLCVWPCSQGAIGRRGRDSDSNRTAYFERHCERKGKSSRVFLVKIN